jgi:hypothetical protein
MPTTEWLEKWKLKRVNLASPVDFNEYFSKSEIVGMKLEG